MKTTVFWDVAPRSLVETDDVSEVITASIVRAISKQRAKSGLRYRSRSDKAEAWPDQCVRGED
jgi:hypothetical protein